MTGRGTLVEVRSTFNGAWVQGFRIVAEERTEDELRYRLARDRDGEVLPATFDPRDVREAPPR